MSEKKSEMGAAFAAAIILLAAGFGFFVMPSVVMGLSEISPWLSYAAAIGFVLAFFGIFWLRARYQRRRESGRR